MLAVADLVNLLAYELARLRCGCLAGAPVLAGSLDCSLLRHCYSPCGAVPLCDLTVREMNRPARSSRRIDQ